MKQVQLFGMTSGYDQCTVQLPFKFSVMFLEKPGASLVCSKIDLITTSTCHLGVVLTLVKTLSCFENKISNDLTN